jgi:starch phosphorylase
MTQAREMAAGPRSGGADPAADLLAQSGCGPVQLAASIDALSERHLVFDSVLAPRATGPRKR